MNITFTAIPSSQRFTDGTSGKDRDTQEARSYHGARAGNDLGRLPVGADLAQTSPLPELLAGVHLQINETWGHQSSELEVLRE